MASADDDKKEQIKKEIQKQNKRKQNYKQIEQQLKESGEKQVSISDPESRNIMIRNNICEVAYSVQTTVDAKNNIPFDYKVTNTNDSKAMGDMLKRAVDILGNNNFTALYDKGYYDGAEFKTAYNLGVTALVAVRGLASSSRAPDLKYNVKHFVYDKQNDEYIGPQGYLLKTSGVWYQNKNAKFKQYKTKSCLNCKVRKRCTKSKTGKLISRTEHSWLLERNQRLANENKTLYKQRKAIVEHPYGTIKRQTMGISTKKGMHRASADVGLMFTAYNFRRLINILGQENLKKYFSVLVFCFSSLIGQLKTVLRPYKAIGIFRKYNRSFIVVPVNRLKFTWITISNGGF